MRSKIVWRSSAALAATLAGVIAVSGLQAASTPLAGAAAHHVDSRDLRLVAIQQSGSFGGDGGTPFSDAASGLPDNARVQSIVIRTGDRVDQIAVTLTNGTTRQHGGQGGQRHELMMMPGEYVTGVRVSESQPSSSRSARITFIEFTTNRGRIMRGGHESSDSRYFGAPNGMQVAGFYGRSGANIDRLGLFYTSR